MCGVQGGNVKLLGLFCTCYPFADPYNDADVLQVQRSPHRNVSGALRAAAAQAEQALGVSALRVTLSHVSRARRRAAQCRPSGQAAQGSALRAAQPDPSPTAAAGSRPNQRWVRRRARA